MTINLTANTRIRIACPWLVTLQCLVVLPFAASSGLCQAPQPGPTQVVTGGAPASLPGQKIGPNDVIYISVYNSPEFTRSVRVTGDGTILLPLMQTPIPVAGLMPNELETRIANALRNENLLKEPNVIISVSEYGTRPIIVTGAVRVSITFQPVGQVTLMDALTRAGGVAPEAGPEVLVTNSKGSEPGLIRRVSLKQLLEASDPSLNFVLLAGDEVRIPVAAHISVLGNVKNNGSFPIPDAAGTTVLGALVLAGGFAGPKPNEVYIVRRDDSPAGSHQIRVPLKEIIDRKMPDVRLVAQDYIYVPNNRRSETIQMLEKLAGVAGSGAFLINVVK